MLEEQIMNDFKQAMKNKEAIRTSTLSLLRSQLKYVLIEKKIEKLILCNLKNKGVFAFAGIAGFTFARTPTAASGWARNFIALDKFFVAWVHNRTASTGTMMNDRFKDIFFGNGNIFAFFDISDTAFGDGF